MSVIFDFRHIQEKNFRTHSDLFSQINIHTRRILKRDVARIIFVYDENVFTENTSAESNEGNVGFLVDSLRVTRIKI